MSTHDPNHGRDANPTPRPDDPSVREGYEVTDANTGEIAVFLVSLFVSVVVFFGVCYVIGIGINRGLDREDGPVNKWAAQNQIAPRKEIESNPVLQQQQLAKLTQQFPTPRLQIDNGDEDLAQLHGREDLLLDHYSWIDRSKGTVRIPIERAMELIAQRGLPVAPAQQEQAAMFGDSRPQVQMPLTDGFARTAYEQELRGRTQEPGEQSSSKADNQ
ncbi:MAG TPA: hypothetical protein VMD92_16080 [Acidobacteriaceae bacterium]|jgi:hypothetical protein|nr:hypothetical protein [Acidobacteriaceae bacterium]